MSALFHAVVIEDESDLLELLREQLTRLGCRVSGAATGHGGVPDTSSLSRSARTAQVAIEPV